MIITCVAVFLGMALIGGGLVALFNGLIPGIDPAGEPASPTPKASRTQEQSTEPTPESPATTTEPEPEPSESEAEPEPSEEPTTGESVLVEEDFSNGIPSDWTVVEGSWKVVDGRLQSTTDKTRSRIGFGPEAPENYRIEVLVSFVKVEDAARWLNVGLDYHVADDWGGVLVVRSGTTADNGLELAQQVQGGDKWISDPVGAALSDVGVGKDHWLTVEVHSSVVEVQLDGSSVFTATNLERSGGGFGFVINRSTVQFDSVKITELPD
jgi:hypothetical protein